MLWPEEVEDLTKCKAMVLKIRTSDWLPYQDKGVPGGYVHDR